MFEHSPRASDLDARLQRFLRGWEYVSAANIEAFSGRMACWLGAEDTPRLARTALHDAGFRIVRAALPSETCAVWTVEDGCYTVRLSPFLSRESANFTLWHEWMDVLMRHPAFPSPMTGASAEALANLFAACITMPAPQVRAAAVALRGAGDKSDVLARQFCVSRAAMRRRLAELAPGGARGG